MPDLLDPREKEVLQTLLNRVSGKEETASFLVKRPLRYAGVFILGLLLGLSFSGKFNASLFTGDVTGLGLNDQTRAILAEWIENAEQENSDHYTFSLLETLGDHKTYLVECKSGYSADCKYKIVFVELDERQKKIINVEIPHS